MNEHSFVKSFHKRLHEDIKVWKIYDPYQGGVPDALLFGKNGLACFCEYKYVRSFPKRETTIIKPALSAQQSDWLKDKITRDLLAIVILGSQDGVVIFGNPDEWDNGLAKKEANILTAKEAATEVSRLLGVLGSAYKLEIQGVSPESCRKVSGKSTS